MEYLNVGQIVRTIGLKGEVKVYPSTSFRDSRFKKGNHLFILDDNNQVLKELTIKFHSKNGTCDNLIFEEISSIEEAQELLHKYLSAPKDDSLLKKDQYFYSDLVGLKVYFDNEKYIGEVIKIEEYTTYQTLRVKTSNKDVLIPFVKAFIKEVNLPEKKIIINFIEGLLWKSPF